jgi:hypothetical protein
MDMNSLAEFMVPTQEATSTVAAMPRRETELCRHLLQDCRALRQNTAPPLDKIAPVNRRAAGG